VQRLARAFVCVSHMRWLRQLLLRSSRTLRQPRKRPTRRSGPKTRRLRAHGRLASGERAKRMHPRLPRRPTRPMRRRRSSVFSASTQHHWAVTPTSFRPHPDCHGAVTFSPDSAHLPPHGHTRIISRSSGNHPQLVFFYHLPRRVDTLAPCCCCAPLCGVALSSSAAAVVGQTAQLCLMLVVDACCTLPLAAASRPVLTPRPHAAAGLPMLYL